MPQHRASAKFWRSYQRLPSGIQRLADETFARLRVDSSHGSLHLKKVGRFWSARVGIHYRAVAVEEGQALVWFWIGRHDRYEEIIAGR